MTAAQHGRVAVVTGAARGLGAALAEELTARGWRTALLGLEPEELARVSSRLPGSAWWEVDVTDEPALRAVAEEVLARFGRVDALVVNAGIANGGPVLSADGAAFDRVVEVNLLGSVRTVRAFLPAVVRARGHVLQVASLAALVPAPLMAAYCASKSGVEAFAHVLRAEVHHHGATVGTAYLSWTDTDMVRGADATPGLGGFRGRLPGPLGRTAPLAPAVVRLADGLEARRPYVYGQAWLRAVRPLKGLLPSLVAHASRRDLPAAEQALREAGGPVAVGLGGAADVAARARRGHGSADTPL